MHPLLHKPSTKKVRLKLRSIVDSIHKPLVAYISDLETFKEMYEKLVEMFKVNNANQILFLKNKLKDIKMDRGESIQSYFMRITEIKNDLLSIGEVPSDRELSLIDLGALQEIGMCSTLPFSTMTGFRDLVNYWPNAHKKK